MTSEDPARKRRHQMKAVFDPPRISTKARRHGTFGCPRAGGTVDPPAPVFLIPKEFKPTPSVNSSSDEGFNALIMAASMTTSSSRSDDGRSIDMHDCTERKSRSMHTEVREPRTHHGDAEKELISERRIASADDLEKIHKFGKTKTMHDIMPVAQSSSLHNPRDCPQRHIAPQPRLSSLDYEDMSLDISPTSISEFDVDIAAHSRKDERFYDEPSFLRYEYSSQSQVFTTSTYGAPDESRDYFSRYRHPDDPPRPSKTGNASQGASSRYSIWRKQSDRSNEPLISSRMDSFAGKDPPHNSQVNERIPPKKNVSFQLTQSYSDFGNVASNKAEPSSPMQHMHSRKLNSDYLTPPGDKHPPSFPVHYRDTDDKDPYSRRMHYQEDQMRYHSNVVYSKQNDPSSPPESGYTIPYEQKRSIKYEFEPSSKDVLESPSFSTHLLPSFSGIDSRSPPSLVQLSGSWNCDYGQKAKSNRTEVFSHEKERRHMYQRGIYNALESRNPSSPTPVLDEKIPSGSITSMSNGYEDSRAIRSRHSLGNETYSSKDGRTTSMGGESVDHMDASLAGSNASDGRKPKDISSSDKYFSGCVPLALSKDSEWLSDVNCFVRKNCIEAFSASQSDVMTTSKRGRICFGQVGIRCKFCYKQPLKYRAIASVSFPVSISGIYESVKRWQRVHLPACTHVPAEIKDNLAALQKSCAWIPTTRQYWSDSAKALGMVDTSEGIRFERDPAESSGAEEFVSAISNDKPRPLLLSEDKKKVPPYVYTLLEQVQTCRFTEADRFLARSKCPIGFPGFECRHCSGHAGLGKYFPTTSKSLSTNSTSQNIHSHMMKCRRCPKEIKVKLEQLKDAKAKFPGLTHGWRRLFFDKIWERLHSSQENDEPSD